MYWEPNFTFSLQDKRLLTAVEEDVFEIAWPWPQHTVGVMPKDAKIQKENAVRPYSEGTRRVDHPSSLLREEQSSGTLCRQEKIVVLSSPRDKCESCRTVILSMHIDPLHYERISIPLRACFSSLPSSLDETPKSSLCFSGDGESDQHVNVVHSRNRTRLTALVLSAGRKVYLPLLPFQSDDSDECSPFLSSASMPPSPHIYWEFPASMVSAKPDKLPSLSIDGVPDDSLKVTSEKEEEAMYCRFRRISNYRNKMKKIDESEPPQELPPPLFGEVIVGELSAIRLLAKVLKESRSDWEELRCALQAETFENCTSDTQEMDGTANAKSEIHRPPVLFNGNIENSLSSSFASLGIVHDVESVSRATVSAFKKVLGKDSPLGTPLSPYRWPGGHDEAISSQGIEIQGRKAQRSSFVGSKDTSSLPVVHHFFLHSIPYTTLWLQNGLLLLSLSCEERIITLHPCPTLHRKDTQNRNSSCCLPNTQNSSHRFCSYSTSSEKIIGGVVKLRTCSFLGSFSFPRGVVPLDVIELSHHGGVAVGTMEHGVLLCAVDPHSGVVQHISKTFSSCGLGSSVFPVTRLVPVFPSSASSCFLSSPSGNSREGVIAGNECSVEAMWYGVLECNHTSQRRGLEAGGRVPGGGMVLVTSIFETQSFVIRLGPTGGGDGILEECPKELKFVSIENVYSSSQSEVYQGVGALTINFGRGLHEIQCVPQDDIDDTGQKDEEQESAQNAKKLFFSSLLYKKSLGPLQHGTAGSIKPFCLPLKRVKVLRSVSGGSNMMLTRLSSGPPIYQRTSESSSYQGRYSKHFILAADAANRIYLLDRRLSGYQRHFPSAISLSHVPDPRLLISTSDCSTPFSGIMEEKEVPVPGYEGSLATSLTHLVNEREKGMRRPSANNRKAKKNGDAVVNEEKSTAVQEEGDGGLGTSASSALSTALSTPAVVAAANAITGLVVFEARAGGFYVAVAHHQSFISIINYSAPPVTRKRKRE